MRLGLGVSHRPVVEAWHGQTIDRPVAEMREYVAIVRAISRGEDPPRGRSGRRAFTCTASRSAARAADLHRRALARDAALAGEIADGVILWLCNPSYIERGGDARAGGGSPRAGREPGGFDIVAAVPSAVTEDRGPAYGAMRRDLIPYFALPFYRAMIERTGFAADIAAYDARRRGPARRCRARSPTASSEELCRGRRRRCAAGIER